MDAKPSNRRRWYQFRLSTWLVLIAIIAWAMATRPYRGYFIDYPVEIVPGEPVPGDGPPVYATVQEFIAHDDDDPFVDPSPEVLNPRLKWPALALAAFLTWKAFWRIRERQKASSAQAALE